MWEIYRTHERKTKQQHVVKTHTHTHTNTHTHTSKKSINLLQSGFPLTVMQQQTLPLDSFLIQISFSINRWQSCVCLCVCVCVYVHSLSLSLSLSLSREKQPSEERTLAPLKAQVYNIFFVIYVTSLVFHVT